jgi:3D (Asp-Asp-Asp) domain-containing protein
MEALKKNHNKIISLKRAKKLVIMLIIAIIFDFSLFSMPALASEAVEAAKISEEISEDYYLSIQPPAIIGHDNEDLVSNNVRIKSESHRIITAYNSEIGQTDNSPCITANGFNLCQHNIEDSVAANFLPFGAKIRIPELFGDKVFVVRDRMNSRHYNRVDIWMADRNDAIKFGVKSAKIEVLE